MKNEPKTASQKTTRKSASHARPDPTWTVARLSRYFGVPPERLLLHPRPGMATEEDLLYVNEQGDRMCELVDGVLVEKAMGFREAFLAGLLVRLLGEFVDRDNLGIVVAPDATIRFFPGLVRLPDVAFISWDRLPGRKFPEEPVPNLAPDLAVEIISKGNTPKEMRRKLGEYFRAGVRLVWMIYPKKRIVEVYTSPRRKKEVRHGQTLDGGDVLPGFSLSLTEFFATPKAPPAS
jgi:Uma2 family endonuclease